MPCAVWHAACVFHWLRALMLSCLVWTCGLWVFSLTACSSPVLHMAGDLFCCLCACVFCFVWAHGLSCFVLCARMSIVLTYEHRTNQDKPCARMSRQLTYERIEQNKTSHVLTQKQKTQAHGQHCQLSWPHPSCYLIIDLFAPPVPRYPPQLLPLKSPCVCSPGVRCCMLCMPCVLSCLASLFFPYWVVFVCFVYIIINKNPFSLLHLSPRPLPFSVPDSNGTFTWVCFFSTLSITGDFFN